ncbi:MAG: hypothetical protein HYX78_01630 [Armatimonadetes bacterium]|nr:hypothetical protein [Armatimonadota bacterium]
MKVFAVVCALVVFAIDAAHAGAGERLFPAGLKERDWISFTADGLSVPVTGVICRNGDVLPGMPLGGLGTGFISLGTDGTLDYISTIFSNYYERRDYSNKAARAYGLRWNLQTRQQVPTMRLPFLGMSVDGKATLLSLKAIEGVESAEQIDYWGHCPVADLEYQTKGPVSVGLRAWAPFIAGQAEDSNTPGAVFEIRLRNTSSKTKRGSIAFSFQGPRTEDIGFAADYERRKVEGAFTGQVVSTSGEGREYAYAVGVAGREKVRFGSAIDVDAKAWKSVEKTLPKPSVNDAGSSVAVDFTLGAKENKTLHLILAWYVPTWLTSSELRPVGEPYVQMYSTRFNGALDVAEYLARNHQSLLRRVFAWQQVVYGEKRLPGWLQDSLINVLAVLAQNSFLVKSPYRNHWWGKQGFFCVNESLISCPQQACLANDQFGEWAINLLFPDLGIRKLAAFKHYQKRDTGQIPSGIGRGTEPDNPWFDQLPPLDGQIYVHIVDRYRLSTGNEEALDEWYPSVKACMRFLFTTDRDGDRLPDVDGGLSGSRFANHYLCSWPLEGAASHISTYWLSTLKIAERMAALQGDDAFVEECRTWYDRAGRSLEQKLWNEEAGSYLLYNDAASGKKSDTVICDQLIGEFWSRLHGFAGVLPSERVERVLATIGRLNVATSFPGTRLAVNPDGSACSIAFRPPRLPMEYVTNVPTYSAIAMPMPVDMIIPSYSTLAPSALMVWSGEPKLEQLGLEIVERTWCNQVLRRNMPWDMPCMLNLDGTYVFGMEYYHNPMLWTFPIAVLKQDIRTACSPGGFVYRVRTAGSSVKKAGRN